MTEMNFATTIDEWRRRYVRRMTERGLDEEDAIADFIGGFGTNGEEVDLTELPEDVADDNASCYGDG